MSSSSTWPIVMALIALALGAVWYDAQHASTGPTLHVPAQAAVK
jgi:hypothetical protein